MTSEASVTIPATEPTTHLPRTSRMTICLIVAGAPVLASTTVMPSIFFAGEVDCFQRTMLQISQPMKSVTIMRRMSRRAAPIREPAEASCVGGAADIAMPVGIDGGGGGGKLFDISPR